MMFWNIFNFVLIPLLTVTVIFIAKRKLLWTTPLTSAILAFISYVIALGPDILSSKERSWYLFMAILVNFGVSVVLTLISYIIGYILKRYQK